MPRKKPAQPGHNSAATEELRVYIERIERLEHDKAEIAQDIKDVKAEAKSRGFDVKAIEKIVKERAETDEQRRRRKETEDLTDVYRAALGMLDGTPLGDSARERLSKQPEEPAADDTAPPAGEPANHQRATLTAEDIAAAKEAGRLACREGKRVIDNPYTAGDPRRAAWDEGWCFEAGSDGMDIPSAWRRSEKKKPAKPDAPQDGEPNEGEE